MWTHIMTNCIFLAQPFVCPKGVRHVQSAHKKKKVYAGFYYVCHIGMTCTYVVLLTQISADDAHLLCVDSGLNANYVVYEVDHQ